MANMFMYTQYCKYVYTYTHIYIYMYMHPHVYRTIGVHVCIHVYTCTSKLSVTSPHKNVLRSVERIRKI